ncbi:MAG: ABC transporter ATP-binding protein [Syntrophobacteraceae bacterium]
MEVLEASHLTKLFGRLEAIKDVSFKVGRGEILGIIGPNGAGKTTLLNVLAGYLRCDAGRVFFSGTDISKVRPDQIARLGFIRTFQRPRFVGELTALENLMTVPIDQKGESWLWSLRKGTWQDFENSLKKQCDQLLEELGLAKKANEKCRNLSFGEIKLLNLGFCLLSDAPLVALDEPVAGMAPHMRPIAARILLEKHPGRSYLIIEHDMDFLRKVADRVLFISQGNLLVEGPPDDVLCSRTVLEAFLGSEESDGQEYRVKY